MAKKNRTTEPTEIAAATSTNVKRAPTAFDAFIGGLRAEKVKPSDRARLTMYLDGEQLSVAIRKAERVIKRGVKSFASQEEYAAWASSVLDSVLDHLRGNVTINLAPVKDKDDDEQIAE